MRDLRGERLPRAGIREERLRATAGLRGDLGLTSWRGRSGRRYVVGVHAGGDDVAEAGDAVLLAVRRADDGTAALLGTAGPDATGSRRRWIASMCHRGATEFHVHRLAETDEERRAVLADLSDACA